MVKAACHRKGLDAEIGMVRMTGPLYSNCHLPSADERPAIKSHRGAKLVTQLPRGLETSL